MPNLDDYSSASDAYNEYKEYYDKAKSCVDDYGSPACQEFVGEQGKNALVAAGVEPNTAEEIVKCAQTRDGEACAKSSAKLAASYACAAATSGAGTAVCNQLVPILIDGMWPVIGPPLTKAWDIGFELLEGALSILKGLFEGIAGIIGFDGDDGPTWTEKMNALRWEAASIMNESISSAFNAARAADVETQIRLGLESDQLGADHPVRAGDIGTPQIVPGKEFVAPMMPKIMATGHRGAAFLQDGLRRHPGFGEIWIKGRYREQFCDNQGNCRNYDFELVDPGYELQKDEVLLKAPAMPSDWMPGDKGWFPAGFEIDQWTPGWDGSETRWKGGTIGVRDAVVILLGIRGDAVRECSSNAVGAVVAQNMIDARKFALGVQEKDDSSWLLWVAALAGAGTLAYVYRDKIKKAMR